MKVVQFTIPVSKEHTIIVQEDKLPYFYPHLHRHTEIQVSLVLKGKGTLIAGNYMQPFAAGYMYVMGSNQPHVFKNDPSYFQIKKKDAVHAVTFFFDAKGPLKNLLQLPEAKSINKFLNDTSYGLKFNQADTEVLKEKILKLKEADKAYRLSCFIDLIQAMADIPRTQKLSTIAFGNDYSEKEGLRMNDVYQYTLNHYTENITLKKIAEVACMTPQAFCRYFKKHTRKTFVNFLNEIRINEACKIITSGKFTSILSIAYETGFSSAVSFNRVFKRITSKSPREYLRKYAEISNS